MQIFYLFFYVLRSSSIIIFFSFVKEYFEKYIYLLKMFNYNLNVSVM